MSTSFAARAFEVRHLQMARALFAALAAGMITFSPDHSASVGLSVFSGFAIATGLAFVVAAWLVYPTGSRGPAVLLGAATFAAGMAGGIVGWRSTTLFFVVVIAWALVTGLIEVVAGARALRASADPVARSEARDTLTVGVLSLVLALGLALVPSGYALQYYIEDAGQTFTLTGITIGVGVFGGYAAIVAVYLGIAAFSPRRTAQVRQDEGAA